jgi:hypothetical protein
MSKAYRRLSAKSYPQILFACAFTVGIPALAQERPNCSEVPDSGRLRAALQSVVKQGASKNGGLGNQEWAAVVNRDGMPCPIVFSGANRGDQWPESRVIAVQSQHG